MFWIWEVLFFAAQLTCSSDKGQVCSTHFIPDLQTLLCITLAPLCSAFVRQQGPCLSLTVLPIMTSASLMPISCLHYSTMAHIHEGTWEQIKRQHLFHAWTHNKYRHTFISDIIHFLPIKKILRPCFIQAHFKVILLDEKHILLKMNQEPQEVCRCSFWEQNWLYDWAGSRLASRLG